MKFLITHLTRCFVAGIVALLPIGSLALVITYFEKAISAVWPKDTFYFPGLGLLAAAMLIYAVGLTVSTIIGRWAWRLLDSLLNKLPALGTLYKTLKQILGYGGGEDAVFQQVVLVPCREVDGYEIGLVTNRVSGTAEPGKLFVFIPGAPNPTAGRLLVLDASLVRPLAVPVNEALKTLVSVGKTPISLDGGRLK